MKAPELAKLFKDFVNREWPSGDPTPGDLLGFFVDWAQEPNVVMYMRGDHGRLMVTWAVISAWFAQRPEDFPAIRKFVTLPAKLDFDRPQFFMPFPFDKEDWDDWVFEMLHG